MLTYEQRVIRIKTIEDLDKELANAKKNAMMYRTKSENPNLTLAKKLEYHEKYKQANSILIRLRCSYFDIEDAINATKSAEAS